MRRARKRMLVIRAYRLGENSAEIEKLAAEGKLRQTEDGRFEVFCQEACDHAGEIGYPGDYIKLDSAGRPYLNGKEFFEKHHRHIQGAEYEQQSKELYIWTAEDPLCPEMEFLMKEKELVLDALHPDHYFQAPLWGTQLSAPRDAVLVFYEILRDDEGNIQDVEFNFVEREEFEKTYELIPMKEKVHYDAFISYSHSEPDAFIAQKLHVMLEHYRVPKKIQELTGKKKMERVFRDREELPLSSDLALHICEALENSEYLIVICSPRSLCSEWVQREIEQFLRTHEKDKVLSLLTEGEPEEVFPEILCCEEKKVFREDGTEELIRVPIEPMAADVRGKNRKEMEKKLKQEFLRILAPMLSCSYDALKQRHRDYVFKRMIAAVSAIAFLAVLFTIYAFYQAAVVDEQYQEARRNQARYLSGISEELLAGGDREGALKTALAIVPEDEEADVPVVPEQMYTLNQALYAYNHTDLTDFMPVQSYELEGQPVVLSKDKSQMLSPEETGFFCMDQIGNAYILDTKTGECIWKITPEQIPDYDDGEFVWFGPVSEEEAVLVSEHEIICLDWKKKSVEYVIREEDGEAFSRGSDFLAAVMDSYIGLTNGNVVWIYDLEERICVQKVIIGDEERINAYLPNALFFCEDGSALAIGVSDELSALSEEGLLLLSVEDGRIRRLSKMNVGAAAYLNNHKIAVLQYGFINEETKFGLTVPEVNYSISVYDTESGECVWTSENYRFAEDLGACGISVFDMKVGEEIQQVLTVSLKDRLMVMRPESGEVIMERNYSEDIKGVERYDADKYLVGLSNGTVYLTLMDDSASKQRAVDVSTESRCMLYSSRQDAVIQIVDDSRRILFCRKIKDEQMKTLSMDKEIQRVEYLSAAADSPKPEVYRCVLYEGGQENDCCLAVYKAGSGEKLYEYICRGDGGLIDNLQMQDVDGALRLLFEADGDLVAVDLDSGTDRILAKKDELLMHNSRGFHSEDNILLYGADGFAIGEISDKGITLPKSEQITVVEEDIVNAWITANDTYIVFCIRMNWESYGLKVWNIAEKSWEKIEGEEVIQVSGGWDGNYTLGQQADLMAVYTQEGSIDIYDLEKGRRRQKIPFGYFERIDFKFMNQDQYLVGCGDSKYLNLWDASNGKILMQDVDNTAKAGELYVDGDEHYFGFGFHGTIADADDLYKSYMKLYYVDNNGRFYRFAEVPYGWVSFEAREIFVGNSEGYYSSFYGYRELRKRAEQILDGEELSGAEKRQYFIAE